MKSHAASARNQDESEHTAVLVGNDLSLVVDGKGNGAVGVAKGDADGDPGTGLDPGLDAVALRHWVGFCELCETWLRETRSRKKNE